MSRMSAARQGQLEPGTECNETPTTEAKWLVQLLVGVFDLLAVPGWGVPAAERRPAVPAGYTKAVVTKMRRRRQNAWTTVTFSEAVASATALELDPVQGVLRPLLGEARRFALSNLDNPMVERRLVIHWPPIPSDRQSPKVERGRESHVRCGMD